MPCISRAHRIANAKAMPVVNDVIDDARTTVNATKRIEAEHHSAQKMNRELRTGVAVRERREHGPERWKHRQQSARVRTQSICEVGGKSKSATPANIRTR